MAKHKNREELVIATKYSGAYRPRDNAQGVININNEVLARFCGLSDGLTLLVSVSRATRARTSSRVFTSHSNACKPATSTCII
jgi:hypothetical protein